MSTVKIYTNEEFMEHIKAYLICTDMSEHVKNFGWYLYWVGLAMIAKEYECNSYSERRCSETFKKWLCKDFTTCREFRQVEEPEKEKGKMRVFISQPMNGKTDAEIEAERERAVEAIKINYPNDDIEVIDSFFKGAPYKANPLWFLSKALELMSTADVVCFAEGWTSARGCLIEYECATAYEMEFMFVLYDTNCQENRQVEEPEKERKNESVYITAYERENGRRN